MELMVYETRQRLYNSYFDVNDKITIKSILNIFQDAASYHASKIGVGYEEMLEKNLYWVLSRIKFDILKQPKIDEEVIIKTWPLEKGRIDFDRDFKISNLQGETLIIGTTKWCVIDTITRQLQRTNNVNYNGIHLNEKNYSDKFIKINTPELQPNYIYTHKVLYSDLDHNKHMNNTNYALLISNIIQNKEIKHFEISYLNECLLNDEIKLSSIMNDDEIIVIGEVNDKKTFISLIA